MGILGQKMEFAATTPSLQTTTPLVYYDEHMMADSNLPVRTLFTDEKSLIVHKHWTTATMLTALIPLLSCYPSLSLSFFVFDWRG